MIVANLLAVTCSFRVWPRICLRNSSNTGHQNKRPYSRTPYLHAELIGFRGIGLDLTISVRPGFGMHALTNVELNASRG